MKPLERRLIKLEVQAAASGHDGGPQRVTTEREITRAHIAMLSDDDLKVLTAPEPVEVEDLLRRVNQAVDKRRARHAG